MLYWDVALHFLIDGYNVLYALAEIPTGTLEQKRSAVLKTIEGHALLAKNAMTVVFDSRQGPGDSTMSGALKVVYTAGETADDWIGKRVREVPNPRIMVVVSNDKGIHQLVHGTGAKVMTVDEFLSRGRLPRAQPVELPRVNKDDINEELKKRWGL